jgi:hypothetical protein
MTGWLGERFGVRLRGDAALRGLVELALRRNPRRAHLLVSTVLGKHIPADPRQVYGTGLELGRQVGKLLDGRSALVLGFAETATGLGHCVAEALCAHYVHSTRRDVSGAMEHAAFEEVHSHATMHRLLPEDPQLLGAGEVLVLVDDEISTGRTALSVIAALHGRWPRERYVLAALVDTRTPADAAAMDDFAARRGLRIEAVALASGSISWPDDFPARAAAAVESAPIVPAVTATPAELITYRDGWPVGVRESGRHGFGPTDVVAAHKAAAGVAAAVAPHCGERVLVLGSEELMYAPTLIAGRLAEQLPAVRVSSTTRSPVFALDEPGYPIRTALTFDSHDPVREGPGSRFAYNVGGDVTDIVLVVDADADTPELHAGLVAGLRGRAERVHLVVLPCHKPERPPAPIGMSAWPYRPDDVTLLFTDMTGTVEPLPMKAVAALARSTGGTGHRTVVPVEDPPSGAALTAFAELLATGTARTALLCCVLARRLMAVHPCDEIVIASIARAGTPVGVLLTRLLRDRYRIPATHYSISLVPGLGIDTVALRHILARHPGDAIRFVDGWSGKGGIARVLGAELGRCPLGADVAPELAVLADPGHAAALHATRDDVLLPSAVLNAPVSGLFSRSFQPAALGPDEFHAAIRYPHLAEHDVSLRFVDAVCAAAAEVDEAEVGAAVATAARAGPPTFRGWAFVDALAAEFDAPNALSFVKPGLNETCRTLVARQPALVLVDPAQGSAELDAIRRLARHRDVPVLERTMPYAAVGIAQG